MNIESTKNFILKGMTLKYSRREHLKYLFSYGFITLMSYLFGYQQGGIMKILFLLIFPALLLLNISAFFVLPKLTYVKKHLLFAILVSITLSLPIFYITAALLIHDFNSDLLLLLWFISNLMLTTSVLLVSAYKIRKGLFRAFSAPDALNYGAFAVIGASVNKYLNENASDKFHSLIVILAAILLNYIMCSVLALSIQRYRCYVRFEKHGLITEDDLKIE